MCIRDRSLSDLMALNPQADINRLMIGDVVNVKEVIPTVSVETVEEVTYHEAIACPVETQEDSSMYKGDSKICLLYTSVGAVMEKIGSRKGDLVEMTPGGDRMKVEFLVPSRGLFGYRNEFLTDTKGEGIMASVFDRYAPMKGEISRRSTGSLVAFETGEAVTYGLFNAQERGQLLSLIHI